MAANRPNADDPPRLRGLWPLLLGPLIVGAALGWTVYFVHLFRAIYSN